MDEVICGVGRFLGSEQAHHILLLFVSFLKDAIVDVNSPKIAERIFTNFNNLLKFANFNEF